MPNREQKTDYENEILECIRNHPSGITITDIAKFTSFSRNTISKYVSVLEAKEEVFPKKIGVYTLYYATKKRYIPFELAISYYKALISKFKKHLPNQEEIAKQVGKEAAKDIKFTFDPAIYKQMKALKDHPISRIHIESFKSFYPAYDIFQPNIEISIINIDPKGKNATFRFQNSVFLEDSEDHIYHIYIMCGITEGILSRELKTDVLCTVKEIYVAEDKKDSYFDILIQI
ncbi:MAG: winged helix-turn-helix transcriptional regulator [Candidatus Thorarchaeota archaeon]